MHAQRIICRDLKPEDILISTQAGDQIRDNKLRSEINQPLLDIILAVKMPSHQVDGSQQRDLVMLISEVLQ